MSQPFKVALVRGLLGGLLTAGAVFFASLVQGVEVDHSAIAAGAAAFSYMLVRFGAEGLIDTQAANSTPSAMA